jgi:hypothetical protein
MMITNLAYDTIFHFDLFYFGKSKWVQPVLGGYLKWGTDNRGFSSGHEIYIYSRLSKTTMVLNSPCLSLGLKA